MTYTAQQIENTPNGWTVISTDDDLNESQYTVFCNEASNTEEDAIALYKESLVERPPTPEQIAEYESTQYARDRAEAYPSLTEQADMAYWDRQNGTTTLDDAIAAVKDANPKP